MTSVLAQRALSARCVAARLLVVSKRLRRGALEAEALVVEVLVAVIVIVIALVVVVLLLFLLAAASLWIRDPG